ncbi:ketopantoate reductase [Frondihabitans sp. PhB188]|uniref:ketopantoate reductase family protein n=1 Tax=Frondihabitans sp. PhB188 TaxID=2485200 RepID=UPI000F46B223|nr:2-dehydropantoate 2-reductase [Frondihabitans sp. PhB188]ROQ40023.1 ketopantoate reductase [Frondihabitans sp. PhB188]
MRILVVGAGAVGGYFGGLLAQAGRDVTFLVRPGRLEFLRSGLVIEQLDRTLRIDVRATTADALDGTYDLVLVTVKSFGLEAAIDDFAPAVGPATTIVPLLNGMRHLDLLQARFGDRVVGGLCFVATHLDGGTVRQLGPLQTVMYGELDGTPTPRIDAVDAALTGAGFDARARSGPDGILQALWEKWFVLAAGGALTTLLGGDVGAIEAAPNGTRTALAIVAECASVAAAAGHEPSAKARASAERTLTAAGSDFTTSLYRDQAAGGEVEAEQILGDLVARADGLGVSVPLLAAADAALEMYRRGRAAS